MAKKDLYVVHGATLKCTMGSTSCSLRVTSNRKYKVKNKNIATEMDFAPAVNVLSFGVCKTYSAVPPPGNVCTPILIGPWKMPYMTKKVGMFKPLLGTSFIMCGRGGGMVTIKKTAQKLDDKKAVKVKCPKCSKDLRHGGFEIDGTNKRGDITSNLLKAFKINGKEHIFYRQKNKNIIEYLRGKYKLSEINKDLSKYLQVPDPIEGHHLVTCEAVKEEKWYKLFYKFCYDINCPQNGVLLPGDMLVACHFEVPLHMGNHEATAILNAGVYEYGPQKNYVKEVQVHVQDIFTDNDVTECKKITAQEIKDFHSDMLKKSNFVFNKVRDFVWLISSDGMHYRPGSPIGCYDDCRTITQKRRLMSDVTGVKQGSDKAGGWMVKITNAFGGTGCKHHNRNHNTHGCPTSKSFSWSKCRWDKKDEIIEALEDDR
ncbi:DUF4280 domain-containing protein [Bacteroides sp. OttesenSCG-928-D19]|nr:DUF4280 domain-containing protein [Bacteroides sp. OttesenSCG-928-D19]